MANQNREAAVPQTREWLYRAQGQVFGPVPEGRLAELVESGELGGTAEIARDDGAWRRVCDEASLLAPLRRAEARARVESEVTAVRRLARRRTLRRGAVLGAAGLAVLAAAVGTASWAAARRSRTSALLEDFSGAIAIGDVTVGQGSRSRRAADDEIAVPEARAARSEAPERTRRVAATATARAAAPRDADAGAPARSYDPTAVKEVVGRSQGTLAPCLREEAERSPEFSGEIPVEFTVGNDGRVSQLWIAEPRFARGELHACLLRKLGAWTFPPFGGERPVVSVSFRIGSR